MLYLSLAALLFGAYLMGSIPFGLLIVRLKTGKDIRKVESGRTGGTNAMRAAGWAAGVLTAVLDVSKAALSVWAARAFFSGLPWVHVLAGVAAVVGHNYSIFLIERDEKSGLRLRGGAGGAPTVGGAIGLWFPTLFIIPPLSFALLYFVGYASVTTMSVAFFTLIVFGVRAFLGLSPWAYAAYGLLAELLLIWALRPNIRRLLNGNERLVGWRARKRAQNAAAPGVAGDQSRGEKPPSAQAG